MLAPSNALGHGFLATATIVTTAAATAPAAADTINVPADHATVQAAIDAASDGDEVVLAVGTHAGGVSLQGKAITLRGLDPRDPDIVAATILDGGDPIIGIGGNDVGPGTVIAGLTLTGGTGSCGGFGCFGAGIQTGGSPTIEHCVFDDSNFSAIGGSGDPTIAGCTFVNFGNHGGESPIIWLTGDPLIDRCRFEHSFIEGTEWLRLENGTIRNSVFSAFPDGGIVTIFLAADGTVTIDGCSFSGGGLYAAGGVTRNSIVWNGWLWGVEASHCLVEGGYPGPGNLDSDPLFVDVANGDLRLQPGSPAIDAGDSTLVPPGPAGDLAGEPRVEDDPDAPDVGLPDACGRVVDIGAHEVTGLGDCGVSGLPDACDADCNGNGLRDACDIVDGSSGDCNGNLVPDECDIGDGFSTDLDGNAIPDECEDCNGNALPDGLDLDGGTSIDCNGNQLPDECDISYGLSTDCNGNGIPDDCDIAEGVSTDCNDNAIPDECEPVDDCNGNGAADICDLADGTSTDVNGNGLPDECEDCNGNGLPDEVDLDDGTSADCNGNGIPDECDIDGGPSTDLDGNGVPDECEDCNGNAIPDSLDLANGTSHDCDEDGLLDECVQYGTGPLAHWLTSTDLDGDGHGDLVVSRGKGGLSVLLNEGDGTFGDPAFHTIAWGSPRVNAGDLNGDGHPDLVTTTSIEATVLLNGGDGTFPETASIPEGRGRASVLALLDGDEHLDLAVARWFDDGLVIMFGNGDGTFRVGGTYDTPDATAHLATADLDGDGDADLALSAFGYNSGGPELRTYENQGDGTFESGPSYPSDAGSLAVDDFDGDGDPDIAVGVVYGDAILLFVNDGTGAFAITSAFVADTLHIASGDLDGDGDPDLVGSNDELDTVSLLFNDGTGTFGAETMLAVGSAPGPLVLGQLDVDPHLDLAVLTADTVSVPLNTQPCGYCAGDTDGNGFVDVTDLVNVILAWGSSDPSADVDGDGTVGVTDLVEVILAWGACP